MTSCFQKFVKGPWPAYLLVLTDFFGLGCIMPLLPFFTNEFAETNKAMWLGAIMSSQAAGVVIGTIIIGKLSDVFGRRQVGIFSMCGDCVMFLLSGVVTTPGTMLAVRACAGLFCPIPCAFGWVIDVSPNKLRAKRLGQTTAAIMGGMFLGFTVAAVVGEFSSLFVAMLIPSSFAGCVALLLIVFVPDPIPDPKPAAAKAPATPETETETERTAPTELIPPTELNPSIEITPPTPTPTASATAPTSVIKQTSPLPVLQTSRWKTIFVTQMGVGLLVGHFQAVAMLMMVNKHGITALGLGLFNIVTVLVMLISNIWVFPIVYKWLGQDKILCGGLIICGLSFSVGWYTEFSLVAYFSLMMPIFLIAMILLPTGQTAAADLSKVLAPTAVGGVQGLTRVGVDFGKVIAPIVSASIYGDGNGRPMAYGWVGICMVVAGILFGVYSKPPEKVVLALKAEKKQEEAGG